MNITRADKGPLSPLSTAIRPHIAGQRVQEAVSAVRAANRVPLSAPETRPILSMLTIDLGAGHL
jgi:hypothetical protein